MATETKKPVTTYNEVADFFLAFANETGEKITNLKLQKLVYYAQAWYLANYGNELFNDDFEAWVHGPVLPPLYKKYRHLGFSVIDEKIGLGTVSKRIDAEVFNFLIKVAKVYMPRGAYELELMTHREDPWIKAREGFKPDEVCSNTIDKTAMEKYYAEKIAQD